MGSLPHTRPHRRSAKRPQTTGPVAPSGAEDDGAGLVEPADLAAEPPARAKPRAATKPQPSAKARPSGKTRPAAKTAPRRPAAGKAPSTAAQATPTAASRPSPAPQKSPGALETAVQAAAELTEIGLHAGARALRRTLSRLSR